MLKDLWQEILTVWQIGILDTDLGNIFIALTIFLLFLFARRIVFRLLSRSLTHLTGHTKTDIDDRIRVAIERPLEFPFLIFGLYISGQVVDLSPDLDEVFGQIIRSLIAFMIFWGFYRILDPLSILLDRTITIFCSLSMHETIKGFFVKVKGFFVKVAKLVVACLGIAAVLAAWDWLAWPSHSARKISSKICWSV